MDIYLSYLKDQILKRCTPEQVIEFADTLKASISKKLVKQRHEQTTEEMKHLFGPAVAKEYGEINQVVELQPATCKPPLKFETPARDYGQGLGYYGAYGYDPYGYDGPSAGFRDYAGPSGGFVD